MGTTDGARAELGIAPSGEQWEIAWGNQRAIIVEVGGGLRTYEVGGRTVLDGYPEDEMCTSARGQPLIPWPNRIEDGRYRYGDEELQLDLSEPELHNAIHGLARWESWKVAERAHDRIVVEHRLYAKPGYPFTLDLRIAYTLTAQGLEVQTSAMNLSPRAAPFATGAHPYLTVGSPTIDGDLLVIPGEVFLPTDARGLPTGKRPVEGPEYDFRHARAIGRAHIDVAFTSLVRDSKGRARVTLSTADRSRVVSLWQDESFPFVEIYTGDTVPRESRRRQGLGVEPMTCAPNAFRSGDGLLMLARAERWTGTWGIEIER